MELADGTRFMVLAPIVRGRKGEYGKLLDELRADGFARVKIDGARAHAGGVDRARQALQARHRGGRGPARDAPRPAQAAGRLDRDGGGARRRPGRDRDRGEGLRPIGLRRGSPARRDGPGGRRTRPARRARAPPRQILPGGARGGHDVHLLRALRVPRARAVAGRARAADLLVQLAARRLRPLHRARLDDGDRPRAGGARPVAVDRRRRDRAVGG